jgi:hypothetical protein
MRATYNGISPPSFITKTREDRINEHVVRDDKKKEK